MPAPIPVAGATLLAVAGACGGPSVSKQPAVTAAVPAHAPSETAAPPPNEDPPAPVSDAPMRVPTACERTSGDLCTPAGPFIERLCARPHQDVALALFAKATPFTRLYLKAKLDELVFDEEVLALRFHAQPKGGMVVGSGNGTYDVLRWDGSCSTGVEAEVFTRSRPPNPRTAHVKWHRLGEQLQNALIASSDAVKQAHRKRGKECKGAMTGEVSAGCEKADGALVEAVVALVRSGGALPEPDGI